MLPLFTPRPTRAHVTGRRAGAVAHAHAERMRQWRCVGLALTLLVFATSGGSAQERSDLGNVSLDSLLAIPVHAAARYAQAMTDAPAAVTVITSDEIAAFGYRTLDQVLARAAGFHVSDDHNYSYIGVRGFARPTDYNNRVLLLLNGHVVNESVYGSAPVSEELGLDLQLLDRVEIVRGPVSALYGSNAMFAVVNLITKRTTGSAVEVTAGDGGYVEGNARGGFSIPGVGPVLLSGRIGREDGEDLYFPEFTGSASGGVARGRDWSRVASAFASAHVGELRLHGRFSTREKGVPTASWGSTFNHPDAHTIDTYAQLAGTFEQAVAPSLLLTVGGAYDFFNYRGWYPADEMYQDETTMHRVGASANLAYDWSPRNRLVVGASGFRILRGDYIEHEAGDLLGATNRPYTTGGAWVQHETHLTGWLTAVAGARVDVEDGTPARLTPRAALIMRPDAETSVKLLYGQSFRSPSVYERAFAVDGDGSDTQLIPEQIRTLEAVFERRVSGSTTLRLSVYDDFVTDIVDTGSDEAVVWFVNRGRIRTRGLEGEVTVAAGGWLLHGGGAFQRAVDADSGDRLTNAPARLLRIGADGPVSDHLGAAAQFRTESSRLTLAGRETGATHLLDATLTYRFARSFAAALIATNVLNVGYGHPAGVEHVQDVIPQDGRRLRLELEFAW